MSTPPPGMKKLARGLYILYWNIGALLILIMLNVLLLTGVSRYLGSSLPTVQTILIIALAVHGGITFSILNSVGHLLCVLHTPVRGKVIWLVLLTTIIDVLVIILIIVTIMLTLGGTIEGAHQFRLQGQRSLPALLEGFATTGTLPRVIAWMIVIALTLFQFYLLWLAGYLKRTGLWIIAIINLVLTGLYFASQLGGLLGYAIALIAPLLILMLYLRLIVALRNAILADFEVA